MSRGQTLPIRLHGGYTLAEERDLDVYVGHLAQKCHRKSLKDVKSQRVLEVADGHL